MNETMKLKISLS